MATGRGNEPLFTSPASRLLFREGLSRPDISAHSPHALYLPQKSREGMSRASDDIVINVKSQASFVKCPLSRTAPVHRFKTSLHRAVRASVSTLVCYVTAPEDIHQIRASAEWVIFHQRCAGERSAAGSPGVARG